MVVMNIMRYRKALTREERARVHISSGGTKEHIQDCPDTPLAGLNV